MLRELGTRKGDAKRWQVVVSMRAKEKREREIAGNVPWSKDDKLQTKVARGGYRVRRMHRPALDG